MNDAAAALAFVDASALLSERLFHERLDDPDASFMDWAFLRLGRILWGWTTSYGTRLGRIAGLSITAWLVLSIPVWLWPGLRLGRWKGAPDDAPARHRGIETEEAQTSPKTAFDRCLQRLGYSFGLMFSVPGQLFRPVLPLSRAFQTYLVALRVAGALLLALLTLTLANVSPAFQAIVAQLVHWRR